MRPLENQTVFEKQELILECEFDRPNCDAVWHKGDLDVKYSLGLDRYNKKSDGTVYRLTIYEAKLDDASSYSCTVKSTKTSCVIKVIERPAEIIKPLEDQECVEKQKATFVCTLSKPRLKVEWYKGDRRLIENNRVQFVQEGKVYKLVIDHAELEDASMYKIKFADECESSAELFVREAPIKIKRNLEDKEAMEEDVQVVLDCEMSKKISSSDEIRWTFNGRRIDDDKRYGMDNEGKSCKLILKNVVLEDEGTYAVEINGSRSSAHLTVKGSKSLFNN